MESQYDRIKEILADGDHPFPVDRKVLKEVIQKKMGLDVTRIRFLSSGTTILHGSVAMDRHLFQGPFTRHAPP